MCYLEICVYIKYISNSNTILTPNLRIIIFSVEMGRNCNQGDHGVNFKEISKALFF